jgi:hypothetical protein
VFVPDAPLQHLSYFNAQFHITQGCGFCPERFFEYFKAKKNSDSIQVRIIGPTIGFAKGMLLKKRGISCIQLPHSMIKAPPSETCTERFAIVVVKTSFPSEENNQMGRFLDPDAVNANNSWMVNDRRKPLSKMYQRMFIGYGVKVSDVKKYTRLSKNPKNLKHGMLTIFHGIYVSLNTHEVWNLPFSLL